MRPISRLGGALTAAITAKRRKRGRTVNQVHLFIKELVSNEQFRRFALANPSAALSAYKLTTAEQHSLSRLCFKLSSQGSAAIDSARAKPLNYWL